MMDARDRFDALADEARSAAKRIVDGTRAGGMVDVVELYQIARSGSERAQASEGRGTR
jgi:hypothetical protein